MLGCKYGAPVSQSVTAAALTVDSFDQLSKRSLARLLASSLATCGCQLLRALSIARLDGAARHSCALSSLQRPRDTEPVPCTQLAFANGAAACKRASKQAQKHAQTTLNKHKHALAAGRRLLSDLLLSLGRQKNALAALRALTHAQAKVGARLRATKLDAHQAN